MQKSFMPLKLTSRQKLVRETRRFGRQLGALVLRPWGHVARVAYDLQRRRSVRVTEGAQALQDEVAVILIYQPNGVLESTFWQIRWMAERGVTVIVVSNAPLNEDDRADLASNTYIVVERPNVGYDFGGYREGIMQLLDRGIHPSALYVMNDSVWFPLSETSDVLECSRAAAEDLWGLFVGLNWRRRKIGNLYNNHIQSYFFRFSGTILGDPAFARYWRRMSLVSSKHIVVEQKELLFTGYFSELGYSVGGLYNWREVVDFLLALDDEQMMHDILIHQAQFLRNEAAVILPLLNSGRMTALEVRDVLRDKIDSTSIFGFSTAMHPAIMAALDFPFLKKQHAPIYIGQRAKLIELGLHHTFPDAVRREVESWNRS